ERELGWKRQTSRNALRARARGRTCLDAVALRHRKRAAAQLPNFLRDIKAIVDSQSQVDPQLRTARLYPRLTAADVRRHLMAQKGDTEAELPTARTIATKLTARGDDPTQVTTPQPPKKSPQPPPSSTR